MAGSRTRIDATFRNWTDLLVVARHTDRGAFHRQSWI